MSAETHQRTLDGGVSARPVPKHARKGYAAILWRANPSTSWERVAAWCQRAEAEGVLQ